VNRITIGKLGGRGEGRGKSGGERGRRKEEGGIYFFTENFQFSNF
jgi:hypothetical protein